MKLVPTEQGYLEWSGEMILQLQATADRREDLLRRALTQLKIHAPRQIPLIEDIEKELSDV